MCINISDEYLDVCDCPDRADSRPQNPVTFFDNLTLCSDPWSGLRWEDPRSEGRETGHLPS